jgi:hypothetical protein
MSHKFIIVLAGFLFLLSPGFAAAVSAQDCYAAGDVNNDGIVLSVTDYVYLVRYVAGEGLDLPIPYQADLNGDCMVDYLDVEVYASYFELGLGVFGPYGGFPVPTCCDPDTTLGASCFDTACVRLNPVNCQLLGGDYHGDYTLCDQNVGDANNDGVFNIGDGVYLLDYLFKGGPAPVPSANGDFNGDCAVNLDDIVYMVCVMQEKLVHPIVCTCLEPEMGESRNCLPGDANADSTINVGDAVYMINYVFTGGNPPGPYVVLSGDANSDGNTNVADAVYLINFVFNGGPAPVTCIGWIMNFPCRNPDGYMIDPY